MNNNLYRDIFSTVECANGNHYYIRYNDSNLICKKCGRFAKTGYLQNGVKKNDRRHNHSTC